MGTEPIEYEPRRRIIAIAGEALVEVPADAVVRVAAVGEGGTVRVEDTRVVRGAWTVVSSIQASDRLTEIPIPTWAAILTSEVERSPLVPSEKADVLALLRLPTVANVATLFSIARNIAWLEAKLAEVLADQAKPPPSG
jgi:hypothetical protein